MVSSFGNNFSIDDMLSSLESKYQNIRDIKLSPILDKFQLSEENKEQVDTAIEMLRDLRDDLDKSHVSKDVKVQLLLDVLEILFEIYDGKSRKQIQEEFFTIFKPSNYTRLLIREFEKRWGPTKATKT